jgi:hypothetical protein
MLIYVPLLRKSTVTYVPVLTQPVKHNFSKHNRLAQLNCRIFHHSRYHAFEALLVSSASNNFLLIFQNWNSDSEVLVVYVALQILNGDDQGCGSLITTIDAPALPVLSGAI